MISRTEKGIKTQFSWDVNNRLIKSCSINHEAHYSYDVLGRRTAKRVKYYSDKQNKQDQSYIYGWQDDTLAFEINQNNQEITHYLYEPDSFIPLMQIHKNKAQKLKELEKTIKNSIGIYAQTTQKDLVQDEEYKEFIEKLNKSNPALLKQQFDYAENQRFEELLQEDINYVEQTHITPELREEIAKQYQNQLDYSKQKNHNLKLIIDENGNINRSDGIKVGEAGNDSRNNIEKDNILINNAYKNLNAGDDLILHYQVDHLGTPQELIDAHKNMYWNALYKAWGEAEEQTSEIAKELNITNNLRFQGQYFDSETSLHYNRYRYYNPKAGRFISEDPIGIMGGLNVYQNAPNPTGVG